MAARETILGIVFFGALIGLGVLTVTLSDVALFSKRYNYEVYFPEVGGLQVGDQVQVYGTKFGKVTDVAVRPDDDARQRVCVTIKTDKPLDLRSGEGEQRLGRYRFLIRDRTLLGGKLIEVDVGTEGAPAVAPLYGTSLQEPLRALQLLIEDNREKISTAVASLTEVVTNVARGKGALGRFLVEEDIYNGAKHFVGRMVEVGDALGKESNGSLARAIHGPELHDSAVSVLASANRIARGIENGDGVIGALVTDVVMRNSFKSAVNSISEIAGRIERGEGALGKLTKEESSAIVVNLNGLLAQANRIATDLNEGKGTFGRLLKDDQLADKVAGTIDRLHLVAADIAMFTEHVRKGGGALGLLLFDEVTRERLVAVVDQLSGVIEDAREAAPVLSVASFLFGTF